MKCETAVLQNPSEFNDFLELIELEQVRSYLEIGSKHGGSLWRVAKKLPKGARIVSVDLPHGDGSAKESGISLQECIDDLILRGYDAHLFLSDSANKRTVQTVKSLAPFDACFIDANHTMEYVSMDFENYGGLARIVAFHDISWWRPDDWIRAHGKMDVPEFWKTIKTQYRHREIKLEERNNGIGVLWRY